MSSTENHKDEPTTIQEGISSADCVLVPDQPNQGWFIRWSKSLRLRFATALFLLLAAGFLSQIRTNQLLSDTNSDGRTINLAGRQRMLCEKIIHLSTEINSSFIVQQQDRIVQLVADSKEFCIELQHNHYKIVSYVELDEFEHGHKHSNNLELQSMLNSIQPQIDSYITLANMVQSSALIGDDSGLTTNLELLANSEPNMLLSLDIFVEQFTRYTAKKIDQTRTIGWNMYALTIVIGFLIMLLVIEPGIKVQHKLLEKSNTLAFEAQSSQRMLLTQQQATDQASFVLLTDINGTITDVNDNMCELTGYSRDKLIGSHTRMFNSGYHPPEFFGEMYKTILSGQIWNGEIRNRKQDGSTLWVRTTIVPMYDSNGKICQFYTLRADLTTQKESEHELQTILDALPSMVIYKDENNTFLRINNAVAQAVGRDPKDIVGHQSDEFLAGNNSIDHHEDDLQILADGNPVMDRIEQVDLPNGQSATMQIDKIPLMDAAGYFSKLVTIATDITHTVEMEQRLAQVIGATKAGIWDWNVDDNSLHTNDRYFTMIGDDVPQSPIKADYYHDRIHPNDRDAFFIGIENIQMPGTDYYEAEFRLLCKDNNYHWIKSTGKVIETNPDGTAKRIIGQHLDIDGSKRLDLAIRAALELKPGETQEETLTSLCAALAEATQASFTAISTLTIDENGNNITTLIAGVDNNQPIQPLVCDLIGTPCEQVIEAGYYHTNNATGEFPDIEYLDNLDACGYAGFKLTDSSGADIGIIMIIDPKPLNTSVNPQTALRLFGARAAVELEHSVTQARLREAAELAKTSSQSKSDFLANMSHEIRTPMTAILGFADMLEEDGDATLAPKRRIDAIKTIQNNGNHLLTIINDILDISKIEAGKMTVEMMDVQPLDVLHQVDSLMSDRIQGKGLELNIKFDTPIPATIQSDPTRLRQILLNLIGNAVKFTEIGSITLRCSMTKSPNPLLQIEIIDTGIGMTDKQCSNIFEAFSQADTSTTRKFGGTGLGLNISSSLAQMLGGDITVESNPGTGSCFRITINPGDTNNTPLVGEQEYRESSTCAVDSKTHSTSLILSTLQGKRILLVEDGPDNRRLISHHLRKAHAQVDFADNGRIGVDILMAPDAPHYDLVLMDMQMPVLDGYGAATELRDRGFTAPIIALTAHAMEGAKKKCIDAGCNDYQSKPINKVALINCCIDHITNANQNEHLNKDAA